MKINVRRVTAKPVAPCAPSTIFVVNTGPETCELYFSNSTGTTVAHTITREEVAIEIAVQLAQHTNVKAVANITDRNELVKTLQASAIIMVADAHVPTSPNDNEFVSTPNTAAMYMYDHDAVAGQPQFRKIYEFEGMDYEFTWGNLVGGPTSPVKDIEDAVAARHEHGVNNDQLPLLNGLSLNPATNNLMFNGVELTAGAGMEVAEW
jgi:hypothetical protein